MNSGTSTGLHRDSALVGVLLAFACSQMVLAAASNLLPNPGFEKASPLGWTFCDQQGVGNSGGRDTTESHTGKASLRIDGRRIGWTFFMLPEGQFISLEPNTDYHIGAAIKVRQAVSLRFRILIREFDSAGRQVMAVQAIESPPIQQPGDGPWREYGSMFRTQSSTVRARVWLELEAGQGSLWFDDVIFVKGKFGPDSVSGTQTIDGDGRFYARLNKTLWIKETSQTPVVDGLAEDVWQQAKTGEDFTLLADYSEPQAVEFLAPARGKTEFKMLRDKERLYVFAHCTSPPGALDHAGDLFRFRFGPQSEFSVTAQGTILDAKGRSMSDQVIPGLVKLGPGCWDVELAISLNLVPDLALGRSWAEVTRVNSMETSVWAGSPAGRALGIVAFEPSQVPVLSLNLPVAASDGSIEQTFSLANPGLCHLEAALTPLGVPGAPPQDLPVSARSPDAFAMHLHDLSPGLYAASVKVTRAGIIENLLGWTFEVFPRLELIPSATCLYAEDTNITLTVRDRLVGHASDKLSFALATDGGEQCWQTDFSWRKELKGVPVPVPSQGAEFTLSVGLRDAQGHVKALTTQTLRRIPFPPHYPAITNVTASHGNILINGEPILLLEGYAMNRKPCSGRRDGLFCIQGDSGSREELVEQLDLCQSNNVYEFCGLFHQYFADRDGGHHFNPARLREGIGLVKNHPALLFWEPYDEPDGHQLPPDLFIRLRRQIHELDPNHPVYMTFCDPNQYASFAETCDVFGIDVYSPGVLQVMDAVRAARAAIGPDKPIHLVLSSYMPDLSSEPRLFPPLLVRAQVYAGLLQGARSLGFYNYSGMGNENAIEREPSRRFKCLLRGLTDELRAVSPFILKGQPTDSVRIESKPNTLVWGAFRHEGQTLLLAVNPRPAPARCRLVTTANPAGDEKELGPYEVLLRKF